MLSGKIASKPEGRRSPGSPSRALLYSFRDTVRFYSDDFAPISCRKFMEECPPTHSDPRYSCWNGPWQPNRPAGVVTISISGYAVVLSSFSSTIIANTEVPADTFPVRCRHTVGRDHSGSGVSLRRAHRNSRLPVSPLTSRSAAPSAAECACRFSGQQNLRQDLLQLPGIVLIGATSSSNCSSIRAVYILSSPHQSETFRRLLLYRCTFSPGRASSGYNLPASS